MTESKVNLVSCVSLQSSRLRCQLSFCKPKPEETKGSSGSCDKWIVRMMLDGKSPLITALRDPKHAKSCLATDLFCRFETGEETYTDSNSMHVEAEANTTVLVIEFMVPFMGAKGTRKSPRRFHLSSFYKRIKTDVAFRNLVHVLGTPGEKELVNVAAAPVLFQVLRYFVFKGMLGSMDLITLCAVPMAISSSTLSFSNKDEVLLRYYLRLGFQLANGEFTEWTPVEGITAQSKLATIKHAGEYFGYAAMARVGALIACRQG